MRVTNRIKKEEAVLILSNLTPILGILFLDWDLFYIFALYWAENLIIGLIYIFKLVINNPQEKSKYHHLKKIPYVLMFIFQYSFAHYIYAAALSALLNRRDMLSDPAGFFLTGAMLIQLIIYGTSHFYYFAVDYIAKMEYKVLTIEKLAIQPSLRLGVIHVTLVLGAVLSMAIGLTMGLLFVFVILKLIMELFMYKKERKKIT